eukprot:GSChrysophyteH1.ASY1.ANO1.3007.1 assembled CDS
MSDIVNEQRSSDQTTSPDVKSPNKPNLANLRTVLLDFKGENVAKRTHAAFHLRTMATVDAMHVIAEALRQRDDSDLMRHELAYILGQMQFVEAIETLSDILQDENDSTLVRHESAEALGAIGQPSSLEVLRHYVHHSAPEIAETCQIAGAFLSVDPAPSFEESQSLDDLEEIYMNTSLPLFKRYRAMFSLRDLNTDASALVLAKGLQDSSALFRHEVAYVLGQLMRSVVVPALSTCLETADEHSMVRHEAAEALGAIGGAEAEEVLARFTDHEDEVINQSCVVALDTVEYWKAF